MESTSLFFSLKDIPLSLPAHPLLLQFLVVFSFLLHILFINLMLGGAVLTVYYEILGLKRPDYDRLAREIAKTITINKSMAVVLGVAPLLTVNVLYTAFFYSANALTGVAWMMVIPIVIVAFLSGYAHQYTWETLAERKGLHIAIGLVAPILFLILPLIFLSNINLMLFPERWGEVHGWLSTLILPNVLPRYLHFLLACMAVSGLFFAAYFTRAGYPVESVFEELGRTELRQQFVTLAFGATALQLIAGPLLFLTLPAKGLSWLLFWTISAGVALAIAALVLLWKEVLPSEPKSGRRFYVVVALLTGTVIFMGLGRHLYRERALSVHREKLAEQTQVYQALVDIAHWRASQGLGAPGDASLSPGEKVFKNVCSGCHALDKRLVGPPLTEIAEVYAGKPEGIVAWTKSPGKKRDGYPQMPAIALTDEQYEAVAQHIFDAVAAKDQPAQEAAPGEVGSVTEEVTPGQ